MINIWQLFAKGEVIKNRDKVEVFIHDNHWAWGEQYTFIGDYLKKNKKYQFFRHLIYKTASAPISKIA
jgi:hypothetical protein